MCDILETILRLFEPKRDQLTIKQPLHPDELSNWIKDVEIDI
jgi:hypothetical protein